MFFCKILLKVKKKLTDRRKKISPSVKSYKNIRREKKLATYAKKGNKTSKNTKICFTNDKKCKKIVKVGL